MPSYIISLGVFVLNLHLVASGYRGLGCCYPDQLMGKAYLVEEKTMFKFAVDFKEGKAYRSIGTNHYFIDMKAKEMYTVNDGQCSVHPHPGIIKLAQCVSTDQWLGSLTTGGLLYGRRRLHSYDYQLGGGIHVWVAVSLNGDTKGCSPVIVQTSEHGAHNQTVIISDLKPYIDMDALQSAYTSCRHLRAKPRDFPINGQHVATAKEYSGAGYITPHPKDYPFTAQDTAYARVYPSRRQDTAYSKDYPTTHGQDTKISKDYPSHGKDKDKSKAYQSPDRYMG